MHIAQLGYRLVLPPGWVRVPLRENPAAAVDAILDRSFAQLPMDSFGPFRSELRKKVLAQIQKARENEGVDLYVPIERMHGVIVPASFVVALLQFDSAEEADAEDLLIAYAAQTDNATVTEIDGSAAVRSQRVVPGADTQDGSRRVDYLIEIPQGLDRWLSVSFSTLGDGDPDGDVAKLLVELFDAIMSTFRWQVEP
jgi:hypothetical protein